MHNIGEHPEQDKGKHTLCYQYSSKSALLGSASVSLGTADFECWRSSGAVDVILPSGAGGVPTA